jgi:hypothetical protein
VILDASQRPQIQYGEKVEFKNGRFDTDDPSLIKYLLSRKDYGVAYTSELGMDPVKIQKQFMVFDDGAELTGPKLVAGFPEKNAPKVPEMILGARSTVSAPISEAKKEEAVPEVPKVDRPVLVTKKDVEAIIDAKLDAFLEKLGSLTIQPKIKNSIKTFKCPICGEGFSSGFAVGEHKRQKHVS